MTLESASSPITILMALPWKLVLFIALQVAVAHYVFHFYRRFRQRRDQPYFWGFCLFFCVNLAALWLELSNYLGAEFAWRPVSTAILAIALASLGLGALLDRDFVR